MKVCFLITTYNREKSCQRLVDALNGHGDIYVINDGSDYEIMNCIFYSQTMNLGKPGYWRTVNNLWKIPRIQIPKRFYKYYIMVPDDFYPVKNFVEKTIEIWNSINDPQKICLNLFIDNIPRMNCWTCFEAIEYDNYRKTQWVDMCFMAEKKFFDVIGVIPEQKFDWNNHPEKSSGVGAFISKKLHKAGYGLYQVKKSIFTSQKEHEKSQLNNTNRIYS